MGSSEYPIGNHESSSRKGCCKRKQEWASLAETEAPDCKNNLSFFKRGKVQSESRENSRGIARYYKRMGVNLTILKNEMTNLQLWHSSKHLADV